MDYDSSWIRISPSSRRLSSRSDAYAVEENYYDGGEEDSRPYYLCPFCAEDFDIVGLCCHIDEVHPVEAKNGAFKRCSGVMDCPSCSYNYPFSVCPVCAKRVGIGLIDHVTAQHGNLLRMQRKRRLRLGGSMTALSILKKELREGNLRSLVGGFSSSTSSCTKADSLLSSFIYNPPTVDEAPTVRFSSSSEACSPQKDSAKDVSERSAQRPPLSEKDQQERTKKCEFVQSLLLSTFLDDVL